MSANEPILDYAKPATPLGGINYRFDLEELDRGIRLTEKANVGSYRAAGWLMAVISVACLAACIYPMFNWADYDIHFSLIMLSLAAILAIGAWQHMTRAQKPMTLEVRPDSIVLLNPQQLWSKKKTWAVRRIRQIRIYKASIVLNGRPAGEMSLNMGLFSAPVLANLEFRELEEIAERMSAITGLEVKRPGPFSLL